MPHISHTRYLFAIRNTHGLELDRITVDTPRTTDWCFDYAACQAEAQLHGDLLNGIAVMIDWAYTYAHGCRIEVIESTRVIPSSSHVPFWNVSHPRDRQPWDGLPR